MLKDERKRNTDESKNLKDTLKQSFKTMEEFEGVEIEDVFIQISKLKEDIIYWIEATSRIR
jgi:hypothetical protein